MTNLIIGAIVFVLCFVGRLIIYFINKKTKKKIKKNKKSGLLVDIQYLVNKFKLDKKKVDNVYIAAIASFLDALIISGTLMIVVLITEIVLLQMILGLFFVIGFIFVTYEIFGRILIKRGYGKDEL